MLTQVLSVDKKLKQYIWHNINKQKVNLTKNLDSRKKTVLEKSTNKISILAASKRKCSRLKLNLTQKYSRWILMEVF